MPSSRRTPRLRRAPSPAVQVEQASFGVFSLTADGRVDFKPAKTVPLKPNQEFGWVIGVTTTKPTVKWREEFTVPYPPETWGPVEGKRGVWADRKVSILEREVTPDPGIPVQHVDHHARGSEGPPRHQGDDRGRAAGRVRVRRRVSAGLA